jgi:hypothetical protein
MKTKKDGPKGEDKCSLAEFDDSELEVPFWIQAYMYKMAFLYIHQSKAPCADGNRMFRYKLGHPGSLISTVWFRQ